jgi:hypothetical protein
MRAPALNRAQQEEILEMLEILGMIDGPSVGDWFSGAFQQFWKLCLACLVIGVIGAIFSGGRKPNTDGNDGHGDDSSNDAS